MPPEPIARIGTESPTLMGVPAEKITAASIPAITRTLREKFASLSLILSVIAIFSRFTAGLYTSPARSETRTGISPANADNSGAGSPSWAEQVVSIVLIAVVLVAAGATIHIILSPGEVERFTEFYILGPGGEAAGYPTEFMSRTPQTVIIGIGNQEYQNVTYTVETFAVQSRIDAATDQPVFDSAVLLDKFSVTVPHSQTVEQPYTFRIADPDTNRLEFLLFKETPPDDHSEHLSASYRDLHLWLRVH